MARKKQAALDVPLTDAEALDEVRLYVAADRRALDIRLTFEMQIDQLKAARDDILAEIAEQQANRFAGLKSWWEAGGRQRFADKKRSAELAGAVLGIRLTPPAVKFAKGVKAEHVIAWLKAVQWSKASELLRTKVELDKPAIIKCVADSQGEEDLLKEAGVTVVQTDEFFIDTRLDEAAARQRISPAGQTVSSKE